MFALKACLILVAAGAPWIVGIAYYWRRLPRDGSLPRSFAELLRERLSIR